MHHAVSTTYSVHTVQYSVQVTHWLDAFTEYVVRGP